MDDEYQQKSFNMSINAPVHSSHRMFSHRITALFSVFLHLLTQDVQSILLSLGDFLRLIWCSVTSLNTLFRPS